MGEGDTRQLNREAIIKIKRLVDQICRLQELTNKKLSQLQDELNELQEESVGETPGGDLMSILISSEPMRRILTKIISLRKAKIEDISASTGYSKEYVTKQLDELIKQGYITKVIENEETFYKPIIRRREPVERVPDIWAMLEKRVEEEV